MTSWAEYDESTFLTLDVLEDLLAKALNAASKDYTGDTNLQAGMIRLLRGGSNTVTLQEYNGSTWVTQSILAASIDDIDATQVGSGVLADARIPSLNASKTNAGVFAEPRIPNLPASKITSETFDLGRIPTIDATRHGAQTDGTLHALCSGGTPGFMSQAHYAKLEYASWVRTVHRTSNFTVNLSTWMTLTDIHDAINLRDGVGTYSFELEMLVDSDNPTGLLVRLGEDANLSNCIAFGYAIEPSGSTVAATVDSDTGSAQLTFDYGDVDENYTLIRITGWVDVDSGEPYFPVEVMRNVGTNVTTIRKVKLTCTSQTG